MPMFCVAVRVYTEYGNGTKEELREIENVNADTPLKAVARAETRLANKYPMADEVTAYAVWNKTESPNASVWEQV